MTTALHSALAWALALSLLGCRDERGVEAAVERAAPHIDTFVRFARWAGQTCRSDVALGSDAALAEATFAPLRADPQVLAAHLQGHVRGRSIDLSFRDAPALSASQAPVSVRNAELGTLQVAYFDECPVRDRGAQPASRCVMLRSVPKPSSDALVVDVVFRSSTP